MDQGPLPAHVEHLTIACTGTVKGKRWGGGMMRPPAVPCGEKVLVELADFNVESLRVQLNAVGWVLAVEEQHIDEDDDEAEVIPVLSPLCLQCSATLIAKRQRDA